MRSYTTGPRGEAQVVFDAAAVERAITATGRSLWERERPFTLVVLDPPRARAAADAARAELERVAAERGLPITLIPLTLVDAGGKPAGRARRCCRRRSATAATRCSSGAARATRRWRAAVDAVHAGARARPGAVRSAPASTTRWTCWCRSRRHRWPMVESEARVEIDGVDRSQTTRRSGGCCRALPGVRRANRSRGRPRQCHLRSSPYAAAPRDLSRP